MFDCTLAGYKHYDIPDPTTILSEPVRLVVEGSNPHDASAVAVYFGDKKVGYIGRSILKEVVYRLLQHNYTMYGMVTAVSAATTVLSIYLPTQPKS